MLDLTDDTGAQPDLADGAVSSGSADETSSIADKALVAQKIKTIKLDKQHHEKAFKRMRRDMQIAMWGADEDWPDGNYRANISGRHVRMKTAALYAKNPKAVARRRDTLDFALWDENPASLQLALQTMQQAEQAAQQFNAMQTMMPPDIAMTAQPELPPGLEEAQALVQDFQQGMARRQQLTKYGKTLEILFSQSLREQKPVDFKRGMKQVVRRTCTTSVGYVELGYQREMGPRPGLTEQLADARGRLDHIQALLDGAAEGDITQDDGEMAELELTVEALMNEPEIVLREGLLVDFPQSTKVIPDRLCRQLDGFIGARHLTIEYLYSTDEVKELFDVDLDGQYVSYTTNAGSCRQVSANDVLDDDYEWSPPEQKKKGMVCVWKHYDKPSGLVYWLADGYQNFLREPAPPEVFVEDFWPVYALTFNAVESEKELFPPSDVSLLLDMQKDYNSSRQGQREHRQAARPRWVYPNGAFDSEEDPMMLKNLRPFEALGMNIEAGAKIGDIFQAFPTPGVDPNLYETGQTFTDMQLVAGAQEAQFGGVSKATATESAIAANATNSSDGSSIDDLDSFLTTIARAAGQILQREMAPDKVTQIAGPGAVWPDLSLADIANEVFLEVEAGSTGKPNQAVEINNWSKMVPLLIQVPGLDPVWLLKEMLRRLDDRLDVTDAFAAGLPSIIAQNQMGQIGGPGAQNPTMQGGQGANNAPKPPGQSGSGPAFGSNQV